MANVARRARPPIALRVAGSDREPPPAWPHQREATARALRDRRLLLHCDMRTGKTRMTIDAIEALGLRRVLVVCPLVVVDVWGSQLQRFARQDWTALLLDGRAGTTRAKAAAVRAASASERLLVAVNFDSAWRPELAAALREMRPDALILDECQRVKAPGGRAALWARDVGRNADLALVLGLSGTPMPAGPLDLYAQFRAIAPGLLGHSFTQFRARYAQLKAMDGYMKVVGYQHQAELAERIAPRTHRVTREVLNLLPATHQVVRVDLSPGARRTYDALEETLRARVAEGEITAKNGMVALLRLQQLTGGHVPTDDGIGARLDTGKRDALHDLLEDLPDDEPAVVIARFVTDLDDVHEVAHDLGRRSMELSGRRKELLAWQRGDAPILAVQIQAGGLGIDLTRAAYCCYYSTGFSLGDFEQSKARVHGPDQGRHVHYDYLIARDTVDEAVYGALRKKQSVVDTVVCEYMKAQKEARTWASE